ncbi:hypothetical protein TrispH2_005938 [Trichoplax sp. H2]|nr:hypothetical protein TrispH2_005938 [Trichoplax sp. H2]|eukprot:RDD41120.1 hypothetical protein TrispH2_005938 [Trichoplax sp. H2]
MPQGPVRKLSKANNSKKVKRLTKTSIKRNAKQPRKGTKVTGADKLRKTLQKNINKSIEEDVRQRASKYEVKPFYIIRNDTTTKETLKKKPESK